MAYENPENVLVLETTKGRVVIRLRPDLAPNHVARIKELARENFYDGVVFHRVIDGFMAQTSEPHKRGTVSAARTAAPNSANSQFFICFDEAPWLNKQYSVFGEVIEGMENVDKIKKGEPVRDPDSITTMRVATDIGAE